MKIMEKIRRKSQQLNGSYKKCKANVLELNGKLKKNEGK